MKIRFLQLWLMNLLITASFAQGTVIQTKAAYYINVNQSSAETVYSIQEGFFSFEYTDNIGVAKEIQLAVYNWKLELLGIFILDKALGLNHYSFDLEKAKITPEIGSMYHFILLDENNEKYEWLVRNEKKLSENAPEPSIVVKPVTIGCGDSQSTNLIEFVGNVSSGKGPYALTWYVLNEAKTDFLYQPKEEMLERSGITSLVLVDKDPSYYVMLLVKDACGNVGKKIVFVSCQDQGTKINSIFIEPLSNLNLPLLNSGKEPIK